MNYKKAAQIRKRGLLSLIAEKKFEQGQGLGSSIGSAISEKFKAKSVGIKEKLDPLRMVSALTGKGTFGKVATTIAGRAFGRSEDTIEYFGGYGRKRKPRIKKDARYSTIGPGASTSLKIGDSETNILAKMYNFMEKTHEVQKKTYEIELAFREEEKSEDDRRHKKLIDSILGRKTEDPKTSDKSEEEKNFLEKLYDGIKKALSTILAPILLTLSGLKKNIDSLMKIAETVGKSLLNPILDILKPIVSGLVGGLVRSILSPTALAVLIGYAVAEYFKFEKFSEGTDKTSMATSSKRLAGRIGGEGEIVEGTPEKLKGESLMKYKPEVVEKISKGELTPYELFLPGTNQRQVLPLDTTESQYLKERYYNLSVIPKQIAQLQDKKDPASVEKMRNLYKMKSDIETEILQFWKQNLNDRFVKPPTDVTEYIGNKLKYSDMGRFEGKFQSLKEDFLKQVELFNPLSTGTKIPDMIPDDFPVTEGEWNKSDKVVSFNSTNNIGGSKPQTFNTSSVKVRNDDLRRHNYRLSVSV